MRRWRYRILLLMVLIVPTITSQLIPSEMISIPGYLIGYLLIYGITTAVNYYKKETIYSKRIRILYLVVNAFAVFILLRTLGLAILVVYMVYLLHPLSAALLLLIPWVLVQMLVLYLFVRYEGRNENNVVK